MEYLNWQREPGKDDNNFSVVSRTSNHRIEIMIRKISDLSYHMAMVIYNALSGKEEIKMVAPLVDSSAAEEILAKLRALATEKAFLLDNEGKMKFPVGDTPIYKFMVKTSLPIIFNNWIMEERQKGFVP